MGSARVRVALVYPPLADATQPYSSLPSLAAFLRMRGRHEPLLFDANVDFVRHVLTRERIEAAAARIDDVTSALVKAPIVCEEIDRAVADLAHRETFLDLHRLGEIHRLVDDAFEIFGAAWPSVGLDATELRRASLDRRVNPFLPFLREVTLPRLQGDAPDAVGISISYRNQVLPAITLARLVRRAMPGVPVILGGNVVSFWYAEVDACPEVFDWCDFLIAFEGETALDALLTALEEESPLDAVPNLVVRRRGSVRKTATHTEDINVLPTPDYRGLPLDRYLACEPVFLLNTSRGCYWSKCEFCSVSPAMRHRFRMRRPDLVANDIATLKERHGARCISFGDDCVPPRMLNALAKLLPRLEVSWQCEVRFERELTASLLAKLRDAGCRNLIFGLESFSPRVLESMRKGIRVADIERILDDCRRADIAVNLQFFFGFPGETYEDARKTIDFAAAQLHGAATLSFGTFRLQRGSGVALSPASFGIERASGAPLAIELAYEPVPPHAAAARAELRNELLSRARFRGLPLCIDAHTLIHLHHAGVRAMAERYYGPQPPPAAHGKLLRKERQTFVELPEKTLLYDYDLDRTAEVSPLAMWVVQQLGAPRSVDELSDEAVRATGSAAIAASVRDVCMELFGRGMLSSASSLDGNGGATHRVSFGGQNAVP
jgi:hypothetical protein